MKRILISTLCTACLWCHGQPPKLPAFTPPPKIFAPAPEKSIPMGEPDSFPEVKMDFPIAQGPFQPTWESIHANYQNYPDWLREAKFGFWVHFGLQATGMSGDWYAQRMYIKGEKAYENHIRDFGHPATPDHTY